MPGPMIFTNGRLVFPERVADGLSLRVADGKIAELSASLAPRPNEEVVDLKGNYLAPGFIDLHVHGAVGRDTMEGTKEAFREICAYHASGGTTSLCLTTVTAPLDDVVRVVWAIDAAMGEIPQLRGAHVEGPFISREQAGAQAKEFIVEPREEFVRLLLKVSPAIRRVTLAPEIPGALELIHRCAHPHSFGSSHIFRTLALLDPL